MSGVRSGVRSPCLHFALESKIREHDGKRSKFERLMKDETEMETTENKFEMWETTVYENENVNTGGKSKKRKQAKVDLSTFSEFWLGLDLLIDNLLEEGAINLRRRGRKRGGLYVLSSWCLKFIVLRNRSGSWNWRNGGRGISRKKVGERAGSREEVGEAFTRLDLGRRRRRSWFWTLRIS